MFTRLLQHGTSRIEVRLGLWSFRSNEASIAAPRRRLAIVLFGFAPAVVLGLGASWSITRVHASADARRRAETAVVSLQGTLTGIRSFIDSLSTGPLPEIPAGAETIMRNQVATELDALTRLVPDPKETEEFRAAVAQTIGLYERAWVLVQRRATAELAGMKHQIDLAQWELMAAVRSTRETLGAGAQAATRRANIESATLLIAVMILGLLFLARAEGARRREAVRNAQDHTLRESEQRFRALVQNASDMITVVDPTGRILYDTPSVADQLGWDPGSRLGSDLFGTIHPDDVQRVRACFAQVIERPGTSCTLEVRQLDSTEMWRWIEMRATNLIDERSIAGIVTNYRTIDERKAFEQKLRRQAHHDALTDLANRAAFRDRVATLIADRDRDSRVALIFVDLDDFKTINDGLGHQAGDELLVSVAGRLNACVRPGDVVARLGGDEFAILVQNIDGHPGVAVHVVERIFASMREPFSLAGRQLFVDASAGIAYENGDELNPDELLRNADIAMYIAKARGKKRYEIFTESMQAEALRRVDLEAELRRAIECGELETYYQPIISLATDRLAGMEALIRWNHPERGTLLPSEFLQLAEESGLLVAMGRRLVVDACEQLARFDERFPAIGPIRMAVNLSSSQIRDPALSQYLADALLGWQIDPGRLVIEVTESVVAEDVAEIAARLRHLKGLGVLIAIDDFGTGYSSLAHLRDFPVDILKIDRSFVRGVASGPEESALARAVVRLGQTFGLDTVAEGIENVDQEIELRRLGCSHGQGYYFAEPRDREAVEKFVAEVHAMQLAGPAVGEEASTA